VIDLLFLHGAVEVVDAEPQRSLRDLDARRDHPRFKSMLASAEARLAQS